MATETVNDKERRILKEAQDRLKLAIDDDSENRKLAFEDLDFIDGNQWPADLKARRATRPCLVLNKMPIFIDQVIGDQRMNRPSIKVIPVDSVSDPAVAKLLGGWIKHVQQISKSDIAVDHSFEHAVACGYGAMRVVTRYSSDSAFEQEAYVEKINNALAVYWGPHAEYDCSDAMYCFVISDMDREEFKTKYKEEPAPFNTGDSQFIEGWATKSTVRVCEYFVKEPVTKTIHRLADGRVVETLGVGDISTKTRKVQSYNIIWYLLSANKIHETRQWVGKKYIPIIPVWGKELVVGGKRKVRGLIRHAKDAQRMYNFWSSADTEVVALQPKIPYILTPKQIDGHEAQWNNMQNENYPYLLVNFDERAPGWPHREAPPQASSAMVERIQSTDQEMRDLVGLQKASLGMQSNERSGVAIRERKKEGDIGTFSFIDNLSRSIEHLGRILIDIAPGLLDTERIVRLGLENGEFDFDAVNVSIRDEMTGEYKVLNDLSVGTYDIVVTVGPSFDTQRTEARTAMTEFIQFYPNAAPLIGDLYAKAMDWPGAEDFAERLVYLLPPEIRAKMAAEKARKAGEAPPVAQEAQQSPEQQAAAQEADLKLQEAQVGLQEAQVKLEQERVKLEQMKQETELLAAQSKENIKKLVDEIVVEALKPTTSPPATGV
uniref:Putative P22-like portal protein n=1 Tax=viral metagenome TaxID=1070528 RepID=A0A6H1ZNX7_9ZZZZ